MTITLTGRRPPTMPNVIRLHPQAHLQQALSTTRVEMDRALMETRLGAEEQFQDMILFLRYSETYHTEREIMEFGGFMLALGMTEKAVILLSAWAVNPWRDRE